VVVAWVVVGAALLLANRAFGGTYVDDYTLPGTSAQQGKDLLAVHSPKTAGSTSPVVLRSTSALSDQSDVLSQTVAALEKVEHVVTVSSPLAQGNLSADGMTGIANVTFTDNPQLYGQDLLDDVDQAVAPARAAGLQVDYGGQLGQLARPAPDDKRSEAIGLVVALVVLLIGFGSVVAAVIPLVSAVVGALGGLAVLGLVAAGVTFASVSPTLAAMMGLGVGIDYALFLTTRFRRSLHDGASPVDALGSATATSGWTVLTAAATVVVALLGLYVSGIDFIGRMGLAAGIAVAVAALAALTLAPALLGLAGRRIDRWHVREPVSEPRGTGDVWQRYADVVGRRAWVFLVAGLGVLVVLSIPVLSLQLGHVDAGASPTSYTERRAYDAIEAAFGPGANAPITVVAELAPGTNDTDRSALGSDLTTALTGTSGVASVSPVSTSPDDALLVTTVTPTTGPQDAATDDLLRELSGTTLPRVLGPAGATGYVTGATAAQLEFRDEVAQKLPLIIAVVVAAAFVLLLVVFRGVLVALKAALLNLLSIAASYGVLVAVFQWGWGSSLLGVPEPVPIESYVPMMMFAIVFGLSMDYEVFLLSRIREGWLATGDNRRAVAAGLSATGRVITCAALIMTSVFASFLLSSNVVVKMLALGLAVNVLVDATVARLVLVPSTMYLFGRRNWWSPAWLDRALPHLDPEPSAEPAAAARPVEPQPAADEPQPS